MFHECEARYPRLDPDYQIARRHDGPTPQRQGLVATLLHLLGFTDV